MDMLRRLTNCLIIIIIIINRLYVDEMEESSAPRREVGAPRWMMQKFQSAAKRVSSLFWKSESPASKLTFYICALNEATIATVKETLRTKLEGLVNTSEIRDNAVATLTSSDEMNITALQSLDVGIEIGMALMFHFL